MGTLYVYPLNPLYLSFYRIEGGLEWQGKGILCQLLNVQISSGECSARLGEQFNIRKTVRECVLFMLCVFALTPPFLSFPPTFAYRDKGFRVRVRVRVRVKIYAKG